MRFVTVASLNTNPAQFEWLKSINFLDMFIQLICLGTLAFLIYEFGGRVINKIGLTTARQRENKKYNEMLQKTNEEIRELLDVVDGFKSNMDATNIALHSITTELTELKQKQEEVERKNKESKKVQYKDRLYQSYRYYKSRAEASGKQEWTDIEADGFWSMFADYESYGGNGYVHEVVEPYMKEFKVIKTNV